VLETPLWLYPSSIVSKLGLDAADEIRSRQQTLIAMLLSSGLLTTLHNNSLRADKPYPVDEYLNDVFAQVWVPLNAKDERLNDFRRQEQRAYVDHLGLVLNPAQQERGTSNVATQRGDAILYVEQHLDQVENYLKAHNTEGLNGCHYHNLLLRIKKIREKYESGK
jgi:hypothetical protein